MTKRIFSLLLALVFVLALMPAALAVSDRANGDWSAKTVTLRDTAEAALMVRVGDIDALNDEYAIEDGYTPFPARNQRAHGYPWQKDDADPAGTDRICVGSAWTGEATDGYSSNFYWWKQGDNADSAYTDGALTITMSYDASGLSVKSALLQLCVDDFQAVSWESSFTVKLNGKDAPFIAELLNHIDQTGPTSYIISAILPPAFYADVASGSLAVTIDETTGMGDGFAVDFAKLLVNYNGAVFTGRFTGTTEPGATVRLLGTSTTVTASATGGFEFEAVPGLNAVRASKAGFVEGYDYGIVVSDAAQAEDWELWKPSIRLAAGQGSPDIDFSQFAATNAWENASVWAREELAEADALGLIPDALREADLTKPITRAEFAAVSVKVFEALTFTKATPASPNPFTDTNDPEVLKALGVGITNGMSATTFEPDRLLNREQAATMLTRVFKKVNLSGWTLETDGSFNEQFKTMFTMPELFGDDAYISSWAKDSVYFMAANGIIKGMGSDENGKPTFAPRDVTESQKAIGYANATRQQALLIAVRMVKNLG